MALSAAADFSATATSGPLTRLVTYIRRNRMMSQTRRDLSKLTERQLTDIGISRDQIEAVVQKM
jgi:uncharacterized protein YjiS (DUF1127 family)